MAIHVARIGLLTATAGGVVKQRSAMLIKEVLNSSQEPRVLEDPNIPSTAGSPTIADYLVLEDAAGFTLNHIDQSMIVTYGT